MKKRLPALLLLGCILFMGCQTSSSPAPTRKVHSAELDELARRYRQPDMARSEAGVQAKNWHKIDYAPLVVASSHGDARALQQMMKLGLDGAGAEEHSENLETLLEGLGDQTFAAALKQ